MFVRVPFCVVTFVLFVLLFFVFKKKTAYEMRISDWSSDVCSSDLVDSFIETGSDLLSMLTKDSVIAARARAEASAAETAIGRSDRQLKHSGIFDRYIQNITGRNASQNRQGAIAPIFNA